MKNYRSWQCAVVICALVALLSGLDRLSLAADEQGQEFVQLVINLLGEKDKDLRAVGLDQVRKEAKGEAATKQFAAQLTKLRPDAQVGLLSALADRGDAAARPAVLDLLSSTQDGSVRVAAIAALGSLGESADLKILLKYLTTGSDAEKAAARASLTTLRGAAVPPAIAAELKQSPAAICVILMEILTTRRALDTVPEILAEAVNDDATVRRAAMVALGEMASVDHLSGMTQGVLKAKQGTERDSAEKALALVCSRIADAEKRADPLLAVWTKLDAKQQNELLPTLGRVGGSKTLAVVEEALASKDSARHEAGLQALCNWPDATVADRLLELAKNADTPAHRSLTFQAYVRVGGIRDKRTTDLERLARLKQAMAIAKTPEEQTEVIARCRTAYTIDALHYVLPYLNQPEFAQMACETIVELAHHRELREPNKVEFDPALDKVMQISKDPVVVDRANRYKKGQTWVRPKPAGA